MKRLRYACKAFMAIMLKKNHVYADYEIISHQGGTMRVCNLMSDVVADLKDEIEQDRVIQLSKEILCK